MLWLKSNFMLFVLERNLKLFKITAASMHNMVTVSVREILYDSNKNAFSSCTIYSRTIRAYRRTVRGPDRPAVLSATNGAQHNAYLLTPESN
jgi:hypothetical protein